MGATLTFLSRNEAIRPKFLGCCMNLQDETDRHKVGPQGLPRQALPSPSTGLGGHHPAWGVGVGGLRI